MKSDRVNNMNEVLYKSCTAGITDLEFESNHTSGVTTFISYARLMKETIGGNLREKERIRGMKIDKDGITLYLETVK